jgi:hypothetical protein
MITTLPCRSARSSSEKASCEKKENSENHCELGADVRVMFEETVACRNDTEQGGRMRRVLVVFGMVDARSRT